MEYLVILFFYEISLNLKPLKETILSKPAVVLSRYNTLPQKHCILCTLVIKFGPTGDNGTSAATGRLMFDMLEFWRRNIFIKLMSKYKQN